jgi:hypothetical protein
MQMTYVNVESSGHGGQPNLAPAGIKSLSLAWRLGGLLKQLHSPANWYGPIVGLSRHAMHA